MIDGHKGLCQPHSSGILLFRKSEDITSLKVLQVKDTFNSFEKAALPRAFPIWMSLKMMGLDLLKDCMTKNILLAQYFYHEIRNIPLFVAVQPTISVVCFRYIGEHDADFKALKLFTDIKDDARTFISTTTMDNHVWLRFCSCTMTHNLQAAKLAVKVIKELVSVLKFFFPTGQWTFKCSYIENKRNNPITIDSPQSRK